MTCEKRVYQCDISGEMFEELYKQYEWAGDSKVWTGLLVGAKHLNDLQAQFKTPKVGDDPKPLPHPRPFTTSPVGWVNPRPFPLPDWWTKK